MNQLIQFLLSTPAIRGLSPHSKLCSYPTTSDVSSLMKEFGYRWSNEAQIYYDYNFELISRKSAERIYKHLIGDKPYTPVKK